jgi:uncharacterized protein (DUF58 family)
MKQHWLTLAISTMVISLNFAQNISFSVSIQEDTILMGDEVELVFTLENIEGRFSAPNLDAFDIMSGPNQTSFVQMQYGKTERQTRYSYRLLPKQTGNLIIGPASVQKGDERYETSPLNIFVKENPDFFKNNPKKSPSNQENDSLKKRPTFKI